MSLSCKVLSATAALLAGPCVLCDQPTATPGSIDLCQSCSAALPYNRHCCPRCALPLTAAAAAKTGATPASLCETCRRDPPPFSLTIAPLLYEGFARLWVRRLKERFGLVEGRLLGNLMVEAILDRQAGPFADRIPLPEVLVPVPLATSRLISRGHNQSIALAQPLRRRLGIPLRRLAVKRTRRTAAQRGLSRTRRLSNLDGVFHSRPWRGERIAIVDDVMTTGATVSRLATTLLEAGAGEVLVFCATRTAPAQGSHRC
jgi:ComF family protein